MLTRDELRAIRERADAATPGPWEREWAQDGEYTGPGDNPPGYAGDYYETNGVIASARSENEDFIDPICEVHGGKNAAFIAAARTDVPALLSHVEELEARLANIQSAVDSAAATLMGETRSTRNVVNAAKELMDRDAAKKSEV